jgi:arsenate reductase (glutaredoxin)
VGSALEYILKFYQYPTCGSCKKAAKFLANANRDFESIHLVETTPSEDALRDLWVRSGLELKKFFNTSGKVYRENNYKERLKAMTDGEKLAALAGNGMLIKRPILDTGDVVLVGFREPTYEAVLR